MKNFAHRRQVKHVSTLLEPSTPSHTLVRHVDSEDITDEKIRTNDLALEINKVSIEDDISNKKSEHDHILVTQSGDPNNKSKPAYKKYCFYCHKNNHGISNCYQKQPDEEYQRYKNQRSRTPQQSFVQYFRSKPSNSQANRNEIKNDYSSRENDRNRYNQNNYSNYNDRYRNNDRYRSNSREYSQNIYRSNSRQRYYNRSPSPYKSSSRYDNHYQRRTPFRSHIDHHTETTPIIDIFHDQVIDLVLNHRETLLDDTITHIDLRLNQEITDQNLEHPHKTDNKTE